MSLDTRENQGTHFTKRCTSSISRAGLADGENEAESAEQSRQSLVPEFESSG